jgi:hypothetical protein
MQSGVKTKGQETESRKQEAQAADLTGLSLCPLIQHSITPSPPSPTRFSLRNTLGFWELTFDGQSAVLKQDQGLFYVAWLLGSVPTEPMLALDFAALVYDRFGEHPDFQQDMPWLSQSRDEAQIGKALLHKQQALEAILDSEHELDPVKQEALRELIKIHDLQETYFVSIADTFQTTGDMVFDYLRQLHASLTTALDGQGDPQPVLRAFAHHLLFCLLAPSHQASVPDRTARLIYRPPAGVAWERWDGRAN